MIILVALLGLCLGWLIHWIAGWLPKFSPNKEIQIEPFQPPTMPAVWQLIRSGKMTKSLHFRLGIELLSAVIFILLWLGYGFALDFWMYAGSYLFFLLIALIDLKYRLVLNITVYPAMLVAILIGRAAPLVWVGGLFAFSMFLLTAWLRPGDVGGGDIKLATLIGLALGFPNVLWALMIGIGCGGLAAGFLLLTHRGTRQSRIAYAPFLCFGAMIALFYNPFGTLTL